MFGYSVLEVFVFMLVVIVSLIIDLVSHKEDKEISIKDAAMWSIIWVAVSLVFAWYIGYSHGSEKASLFLTGYVLEKSLSVDNLFIFIAIFSSFSIQDKFQHRVLYFGILGAIVFRFIFIAIGTGLAMLSDWVLVFFGIFVIWSAYQMYVESKKEECEIEDYSNHWSVNLTKRFFKIHPRLEGHSFFLKKEKIWYVTPLFLCLVIIEISDIMFAFDSVPAVIAVTREPFLVYTSNIFAILGLRSMYFLLAAAKRVLCHLEKAVIVVLLFIGFKMLSEVFKLVHISPNVSLAIVMGVLVLGIIASYIFPEEEPSCEEK